MLPRSITFSVAVALLTATGSAQAPENAGTPTQQVDFDRDVRPILSAKCFACHGPDRKSRKAKLRLDLAREAFRTRGKRPAAIVPGDAQASELVRRITHADPKERMPPAHVHKQLDAAERQTLITWIEQGAEWKEHWSFVTPTLPVVPEATPGFAGWGESEIDRFLSARLAAEKLQPSAPTDRRTLIRRVTLDLIGLPPSNAEIAAFIDDRRADAFERVVDRLLASPRYGENMARYWLDAARYGDTHGLHLDNYREMWPFRDWVIGAFNGNLPFDRFAKYQLAGDLLPDPTLEQKIASGFNRCHVTTNEGGSIKEEVYVRNVIDRVSTTGTVFLGLTLGCAVCHDHKFDPIEQREFFQMFAFFNNLDGNPMDGNKKIHAPVIQVPTAEDERALARLKQEREVIEKRVAAALNAVDYAEPPAVPEAPAAAKKSVVWVDDELPAPPQGESFEWIDTPADLVHSGRRAMKRTGRQTHQHFFPNSEKKLRIGAGDILFAWVRMDPADRPRQLMLQWNADGKADWNHRAYWGENLIDWGKDGTTERHLMGPLPTAGNWVRLAVPAAKVGLFPGMTVHGLAFTQFDGTAHWDTAGIVTSTPQEPVDYAWIDDTTPDGAELVGNGKKWQWKIPGKNAKRRGQPLPVSGERVLMRRGKGLIQDVFTKASPGLRLQDGDRLFAHVYLDPKNPPRSVQLQFNNGTWEHRVRWGAPAHGNGRKGGADFVAGPLPRTGEWVRLEVAIKDVDLAPNQILNGWAFTQVDGRVWWDKAGVRTWSPPTDRHLRSLAAWEPIAKANQQLPKDIRAVLDVPKTGRSIEQTKVLQRHYVRHVFRDTRATFAPFEKQLAKVAKAITDVEKRIPTTLIMKERAEPKQAFVLRRGQYDQKGDPVERITPAALPPMAPELSRDRLGLAEWLLDPKHPLTARVTVNRFWQQFFGTGLVKTSEDFGNQGERPSHPQLLDWLATRFVNDGWDTKRLIKRMVMSAAYRQSSKVTPDLVRRDPENRLLARGPRFRLDAETLRDQALALSGLLVTKLGGPGVKPPQPAGLWKAVGYVGSNTDTFRADKGSDKIHRRSIYTFWKRTSPPPQMSTFDVPSREECRVRRERTNTPLQALLLMNDPQYVEAANHFAARTLRSGGRSDESRVAWMFETATARPATTAELADILRLVREQRKDFTADPMAAKALNGIATVKPKGDFGPIELATWTMVANLILNLDEVITKG